jgi:hypothetical protein
MSGEELADLLARARRGVPEALELLHKRLEEKPERPRVLLDASVLVTTGAASPRQS